MHTYLKQSDSSENRHLLWSAFQKYYPKEAAQLEQIWKAPSLIHNSLWVRDDVLTDGIKLIRKIASKFECEVRTIGLKV